MILLADSKVNFISLPWLLLPPLQELLEESRVAQIDMKTLSTVPMVSLQELLKILFMLFPSVPFVGFSGQVDRQENWQDIEVQDMVYFLASALIYSKKRIQRKQK